MKGRIDALITALYAFRDTFQETSRVNANLRKVDKRWRFCADMGHIWESAEPQPMGPSDMVYWSCERCGIFEWFKESESPKANLHYTPIYHRQGKPEYEDWWKEKGL